MRLTFDSDRRPFSVIRLAIRRRKLPPRLGTQDAGLSLTVADVPNRSMRRRAGRVACRSRGISSTTVSPSIEPTIVSCSCWPIFRWAMRTSSANASSRAFGRNTGRRAGAGKECVCRRAEPNASGGRAESSTTLKLPFLEPLDPTEHCLWINFRPAEQIDESLHHVGAGCLPPLTQRAALR